MILRRHALKPTLLPVVSFLGPAAAALLTGSLVVEQVFGLPGVGRYFVQGAINRDYTLVMGMVIFYAALILLLNLARRPRCTAGSIRGSAMTEAACAARRRQSLWGDAWQRLQRSRAALVAASLLLLVCALALRRARGSVAYAVDQVDWTQARSRRRRRSPTATGSAPTPTAATCSCASGSARGCRCWWRCSRRSVSVVIGVAWGATAGYLGGRVDGWMMRVRRRALRAAVHVLRDHPDRGVRPQPVC